MSVQRVDDRIVAPVPPQLAEPMGKMCEALGGMIAAGGASDKELHALFLQSKRFSTSVRIEQNRRAGQH